MANSKNLSISPNPNQGNFQAVFHSEQERTLELVVADVTGRVIYKQTIQASSGKNTVQVNLPGDIPKPSILMVSLENKDVKYSPVKMNYQY